MAKVNKNVMEQFIKGLSIDSKNNMEVPSSMINGIFHVIVKKEIIDYLTEHYPAPIVITRESIKTIANALERNPAQITYYLKEIKSDKTLRIKLDLTKESVTERVVDKIKKYFIERGENESVSIYTITKEIGESLTTIYAIEPRVRNIVQLTRTHDYDEKGRSANYIRLTKEAWNNINHA